MRKAKHASTISEKQGVDATQGRWVAEGKPVHFPTNTRVKFRLLTPLFGLTKKTKMDFLPSTEIASYAVLRVMWI
jgi:hypothetical protein